MAKKHDSELLRELIATMQQRNNTAQPEHHFSPAAQKRSNVGVKKSDSVTDMQRRSSEEDEDRFTSLYGTNGLLEPPYPFADLWRIYEECDVLMSCVEARIANCELPHDFEFTGDDKTEKDLKENLTAKIEMRDFFSRVNEKHSFLNVREKVRRDREVTANAFVEALRNLKGKPERLYYTPSTYMRVTELDKFETQVAVTMPRSGKLITVQCGRRFRRFARLSSTSNVLTWFKEFGDPRIVDATTGLYVKDTDGNSLREPADYPNKATEIWWFRDNWAGNSYGIPKWVSVLLSIKGRYTATWVNFDHLDQGATPPFVLMPTGGKLSPRSREELERVLEEIRDPSFYNRPIVLEIEPDIVTNVNKGSSKSQTGVEVLKLRDPSAQDFMFSQYLKDTEDSVRKAFRLPPLFIGSASGYSNATSYSSIEIAESQNFEPTRNAFDEKITTELIQNEFGFYQWRFKTKSAKISDRETFYKIMRIMAIWGGASLNQTIDMGNDVLGTDWSRHDGAIYNEPWSLVSKAIGPQNLMFTDKGIEFINPSQGAAAAPQVAQPTPQVTETAPHVTDTAPPQITETSPGELPATTTKEESDPEQDEQILAQNLFSILSHIEERGFQPKEISEDDYAL